MRELNALDLRKKFGQIMDEVRYQKEPPESLRSFHQFLNTARIQVVPVPEEKPFEIYSDFIPPKDLPVLNAARSSKARDVHSKGLSGLDYY
ncbi:MAG: hypothetical protein EXS63_04270 [Candidatus Omnitrophica bacterium]|nr:hypothetical protein [Candidatus Omnitrophota bacterium]